VLGATLSDGTILYDQMYVEDPLRDAFDKAGTPRSPEEREAIRDGLKTLFHEDNHLLARDGSRSRLDAFATNRDPGVREFEEGITEAYSYARLDRFISETGFDEVVPGIDRVQGRSTYPSVAPAATQVAQGIGERTGLGTDEVLDRLNRVDHEEKWNVATDLMYESSDLPGMVTDDRERDAAKARIREAMRDRFVGLRDLRASEAEGRTEHDVRTTSIEAGRAAIADANAEIDRMERSHRETGRILDDRTVDRTTDQDRAATEQQDRTSAEQDRPTLEQDPPDPPTQQDRLDLDPSLDPSQWAPPTAESRIPRPTDPRNADQSAESGDPAARTSADRADRAAVPPDPNDRLTNPRDRADRSTDPRDPADQATESRDAAGRPTGARDEADQTTDPSGRPERDANARDASDRAVEAAAAADRPVDGRKPADRATEPREAADLRDRSDRDAEARDAADRAAETREVVDRVGDGRRRADQGPEPRPDRRVREPQQGDQRGADQQRGQGAQRVAAAARNAAYAADAVVEGADPTSSGSRRGRARQGRGGSDAISKLRDLTHGGQRPASEAARTPGEHPQARHHGRGVHSPAQHNQRLRDQHRPQRDQGEGIER
jgi:hypothetical protein